MYKLLMKTKKFIFFISIALSSLACYSQSHDSKVDSVRNITLQNLKKLASYNTDLPGKDIENFLVGSWRFICLETTKGVLIDTLKIEYYDSEGYYHHFKPEKAIRPDIVFSAGQRYERLDTPMTNESTGSWHYEDSTKILNLEYDKPYFAPDLESLMKRIPTLKLAGIKNKSFWIYKITNDELFIIEAYPINENEQWFNLAHYKKIRG